MSWLPHIFPRDRVQRSLQNLTSVVNAYRMQSMGRIDATNDDDVIKIEKKKLKIYREGIEFSIDQELNHRLYRSIINDI